MRNLATMVCAAALAAIADASAIIMPPTTTKGEDIAIVWIHGMDCDNEAYQSIAAEVQSQGAGKGQKIWVGLPQFLFDKPEPILIDHYVTQTIASLRDAGFTGDNIVMAGHSLGGVMSQKYTKKNEDTIKAQVLMGSVLTRDTRDIQDDGTTKFSYPVPTLTLGGTKDGLLRISRTAESFWHSYENVEKDQANLYPTVALDGVSHMGFMSGVPPKAVAKRDLVMDVTEEKAHSMSATAMVEFFDQIIRGKKVTINNKSTKNLLQPLLDAMELEGFYGMKPPCYSNDLLDPVDDPTCLHGSPWNVQYSQPLMGGKLPGSRSTLVNDDNFHRVQSVAPVHLSEIDNDCDASSTKCQMHTVTVSENIYGNLDKFDTGYYPISASETKTKMSSRQKVQVHGGNPDADFTTEDEDGNRCADINDASINWAYSNLSKTAKKLYDNYGVQMVTGDDLGPYNEGPLWIWTYMSYKKDLKANTYTVQSPMMRTPTDYFVGAAAGFHYCKVLSPFRAMEWMMVDGLFDHNGIKGNSNEEDDSAFVELFLQ